MEAAGKIIRVFEWGRLSIGEQGFRREHFEALATYNECYEGRYFTLLKDGVRFGSYVGAIQVRDITIEILPKADKAAGDPDAGTWHGVLLDMLHECRWMQVDANEQASLRLRSNSILEAYLRIFLESCTALLREGLVRKYRLEEGNSTALKGKLMFAGQLRHNAVHAERFYIQHTVYDANNLYNRILLKAIKAVRRLSISPALNSTAANLMLDWPEVEDVVVGSSLFERLTFDRKTARYRSAILIAKMILLQYRPDISTGHNEVLAILFDMNALWEEFIFRRLRNALYERFPGGEWNISRQDTHDFFRLPRNAARTIRPDIVLKNEYTDETYVLDTKWKMPDPKGPDDNDLKQMLVYNLYWKCGRSMLLYPWFGAGSITGSYTTPSIPEQAWSQCSMCGVQVLDGRVLSSTIGADILASLQLAPVMNEADN